MNNLLGWIRALDLEIKALIVVIILFILAWMVIGWLM